MEPAVKSLKTSAGTTSASNIGEDDDRYKDDAYAIDNFETLGWKVVLLLQFQTQFEAIIMIGVYISYICSLLDMTFAYASPPDKIPQQYTATGISFIYCFDVIYMVDILSMISYKNAEWVEMKHLHSQRHSIILIFDIISIIPLDAVYYSLTVASMRVIYTLRLRYVFRIFRLIMRILRLKNTVGYNPLLIEFIVFLINTSLLLVTVSCIFLLIECESSCEYGDLAMYVHAMYIMAGKITGRGYPVNSPETALMFCLYAVTNYFSFLYISGFTIGLFLIAVAQKLKQLYLYENMKSIILTKTVKTGLKDPLLVLTCKIYFKLFWKNRKGFHFNNADVKIIPEVMAKEISLDIAWDALKHSHLFRKQEVHFLRFVAQFVRQKFMIPGEVIYKRNQFKSAMVYIVTGVIQILSEEDGETPILSFSGGTCIGESTIFIDYPSTCSVVCQSYCEVYLLYKKDFLKILVTYPDEGRLLLTNIKQRYKKSREFKKLVEYSFKEKHRKLEVLTLKWLKTTLHELMLKDTITVDKYLSTLSLDERDTRMELDKLLFCADYLDLMVITDQLELVTDIVFLRTTCPCILQPDSFIVATWNNIIAIVSLIFAFVFPYYACFQPETSTFYLIFSYTISILWGLDIYINLSTAIKTKDGIVTEIGKIILMKMQTIDFFLDLFAAVPLDLFGVLVVGTMNSQVFVLLQATRLLKVYKISSFFDKSLHSFGFSTQMRLKYTIYMMLLIYSIAALFYLQVCYNFECKDEDNLFIGMIKRILHGNTNNLIMWIYFSVQQVTSIGFTWQSYGNLDSLHVSIIIVELMATLFYVCFLAHSAGTEALSHYGRLTLREYTSSIKMVFENLNVNSQLYEQLVATIRGQLKYNGGADLLYTQRDLAAFYHRTLTKELRKKSFTPMMKLIPLFSTMSDEVIGHLAAAFYIHNLVPGDVVSYSGEVCKEMHIIMHGYCKVIGSLEEEVKIIKPGDSISAMEMCFEIPIVNTVVAITHCILFTIGSYEFLQALQLHPEVIMDIKIVAADITQSTNIEALYEKSNLNIKLDEFNRKGDSFKHFGYKLQADTKDCADFHSHFDNLGFFGFLRYIFMRHTIRTYGNFIFYWEISRCVFAFATGIFAPVAMINACPHCVSHYFLHFCDITAWIDIYVRHHVCYYDERGIEITHPLKTAIHYWKHGFLMDLLGVFPFEQLATALTYSTTRNRQKTFFKMLRLLQISRIVKGIHYLNNDLISPMKIWTTIKFVPIVILTVTTIGALTINKRCEFGSSIEASEGYTTGVRCDKNTWIGESDVAKPLDPLRVHLYGAYGSAIVLMGPSLGGLSAQTLHEIFLVTVLNVLGFWFFIFISAKIIAENLFRNTDLTSYQEAMHSLVKFLSYRHIDVKLKKEVIEHFEYIWRKQKGKKLHQVVAKFNFALQEDILLDAYGKALKESTIFLNANDSFFKSLLLHVKHEIVMKRGIICKVNNVHSKVYFIFKGKVEVLGPDYNRLLILPVGSIFGNIDNCVRSRQTLTMVAKGHVELLTIDTTSFHKIISSYQNLKVYYRKLTALNTDYLLGGPAPRMTSESDDEFKSHITIASAKSLPKMSFVFENIQKCCNITIWEMIVVLVCYVGFCLELYQMAVQEHSTKVIVCLYFLDLLLLINIYLKFTTAYENEYGVFIRNKGKIAAHYIKTPTGFPLHLVSIIPFEMVVLAFMKSKHFWLIWSYGRCNRLVKVFFVISYFHKRNQQLNINVYIMRTFFLLVWTTLLMHVFASLVIIVSCFTPELNVSPLVKCNWANMTKLGKFAVYKKQFSMVLYIFTMTNPDNYYPNATFLIFLITCMLIGGKFLAAVVIAEVSATLDIILTSRVSYDQYIQKLKEHMVRERISPALLERVWLYIRLLWTINRGLQFPNLLLEAPYYLREGVLNSMFGYHLRRHHVFRSCHVDLVRQMAAQMRTRTFFPGDYITFINDIDGCMYFIHEGAVEALSEEDMYTEKIEATLHQGEMFGFEQGLHLRCSHEYTYRAKWYTVIVYLDRKDWIYLLEFFPASKDLLFADHKEPL